MTDGSSGDWDAVPGGAEEGSGRFVWKHWVIVGTLVDRCFWSDGHGRFSLSDPLAGEYTVCALMPAETEEAAPMVCLGDVVQAQAREDSEGCGR